jgi:3-phosphoshikimate 1-carboxyvinyltransferase
MTWQGIRAAAPVTGNVNVPGSKSLSNRALVLAALSEGPSQISGLLLARDTRLMIAALQQLGIKIEVSGDHASITPNKLIGGGEINVGLAGTVMRFIPLVAALASGETTFVGDPEALKRPMQTTIESLRQLGISVSDSGSNTLPITVSGVGSVDGGELAIDLSESSQFLTALLLVGAKFKNGVKVTNTAKSVPSLPHIQMTISMLEEHGVVVEQGENYWQVLPSIIRPINRAIEPDLSNATVFLAAAMLTKGSVTVAHWPAKSNQPSDQIQSLFLKLGAHIEMSDAGLTLHAPEKINPIDFDMSEIGEITPTIAAILSAASGSSRLTGIAHLRGHETDRLAALTSELAKVGIRAKELPDGIEINGGTLKAASTELFSYHDHRMATFAALLGLLVDLKVNDIQTTEKTMPDFAIYWKQFVTGVA